MLGGWVLSMTVGTRIKARPAPKPNPCRNPSPYMSSNPHLFTAPPPQLVFRNPITRTGAIGSAVGIGGVLLYSLVKQHYDGQK